MRYKGLEDALWIGALAGELAFGVVACVRGRWRRFPASTTFIVFPACASILFMWLRKSAPASYASVYWWYMGVNFVLQMAVIYELGRTVLDRAPGIVRTAWKQFLFWCVAGFALALVMALLVAPPAETHMEQIEIRADLFMSLLTCELVIAMMTTSSKVGLGWRNHVMAIGQGLLLYSTAGVVADSMQSYFGLSRYYALTEYSVNVLYLGVLAYWCIQLWKEEPAPGKVSPELRKYMVELHQRVHYDLGEMER